MLSGILVDCFPPIQGRAIGGQVVAGAGKDLGPTSDHHRRSTNTHGYTKKHQLQTICLTLIYILGSASSSAA